MTWHGAEPPPNVNREAGKNGKPQLGHLPELTDLPVQRFRLFAAGEKSQVWPCGSGDDIIRVIHAQKKRGPKTAPEPVSTDPSSYASICGRPFSGQSMWKNFPRGLSVRS